MPTKHEAEFIVILDGKFVSSFLSEMVRRKEESKVP